jgi:hypothetical protein
VQKDDEKLWHLLGERIAYFGENVKLNMADISDAAPLSGNSFLYHGKILGETITASWVRI